jgi:hypothetical protein
MRFQRVMVLALALAGCEVLLDPLPGSPPPPGPGQFPADAGASTIPSGRDASSSPNPGSDASVVGPGPGLDASTETPPGLDAATQIPPGRDAASLPPGADGGQAMGPGRNEDASYPGLPASCQGLINRGGGGCIDTWAGGSPAFQHQGDVQAAVSALDPANPALFDPDGTVPEAKRPAFANAVAAVLDPQGLCVRWDGQELYVRPYDVDYSETYKLFNRNGFPNVFGHYQCTPADTIPGAALPVPSPAQGCNPAYLPPGTTATAPCQHTGGASLYFSDVEAAVLQVIATEQPKGTGSIIFDLTCTNLNFQAGWEDKSYRILDNAFFLNAVAAVLAPQGYCFQSNGYDTLILKKDAARSEDYDLVQSVGCGGTGQQACKPHTPAGEYVRYPGKGSFCELAEF